MCLMNDNRLEAIDPMIGFLCDSKRLIKRGLPGGCLMAKNKVEEIQKRSIFALFSHLHASLTNEAILCSNIWPFNIIPRDLARKKVIKLREAKNNGGQKEMCRNGKLFAKYMDYYINSF
jgi:hypothetical protein